VIGFWCVVYVFMGLSLYILVDGPPPSAPRTFWWFIGFLLFAVVAWPWILFIAVVLADKDD
jgi:hypothetical protein